MKDYNVLEYITPDELKKFRKKFHMTQNDFAKIIGVSRTHVQRMLSSGKLKGRKFGRKWYVIKE